MQGGFRRNRETSRTWEGRVCCALATVLSVRSLGARVPRLDEAISLRIDPLWACFGSYFGWS